VAKKKVNKILLANPRACIGCRSCELFCSFYHHKENNPSRALLKIVKDEVQCTDIPVICQHCDKPSCVEVCPVQAFKIGKHTGIPIIDHKICIGCRACVTACPFGAIRIDPKTGETNKCDLCDGDPQCVKICKQGAILFAERDLASRLLTQFHAKKTAKLLINEKQTTKRTGK
jgi:Fe-S-cluster-containing dehydrogenase component